MMDHRGEIANRLKLSHEKLFICTMIFTNYLRLFEENMKTMKLDAYTKKNKLLLYAQLHETEESLHSLSDCLFNERLQKGANLDSISVSQLSRRLNGMNPVIFQQLFLDLVSQIHQKTNYTRITML